MFFSESNIAATITVRVEFPGIHMYRGAPVEVEFLQHPHRHLFKIAVELSVDPNGDREVEFFMLHQYLKRELVPLFEQSFDIPLTASCEALAKHVHGVLQSDMRYCGRSARIEVSEDGENSGSIYVKGTR